MMLSDCCKSPCTAAKYSLAAELENKKRSQSNGKHQRNGKETFSNPPALLCIAAQIDDDVPTK